MVGLKEFHVESQQLVEQLIDHGAAARCTGMTGANAESSRSHSIMQFSLKKPQKDGSPGGREVRTCARSHLYCCECSAEGNSVLIVDRELYGWFVNLVRELG